MQTIAVLLAAVACTAVSAMSDCDDKPDFNVTGLCPVDCECKQKSNSELVVDCMHGVKDQGSFNISKFSASLDDLLTTDYVTERLTDLQIVHSPLKHVPAAVCQLRKLEKLHLDGNKLKSLPDNCFQNFSRLETLSARYNDILALQNGVLDGLNELVVLDLRDNKIASIGLQVFSNVSELTKLRHILLYRNNLTSLDPWPYIRGLLGNSYFPVYIDLANNAIATFTNTISWQFTCETNISYLHLDVSDNRIRHVTDLFDGWGVSTITEILCFYRGAPGVKLWFSGITYDCDCKDYPIYTLSSLGDFVFRRILKGVHCNGVNDPDFFGKEAKSVNLDDFVCDIADGCPAGCGCVYQPATATVHINCRNSNVPSLPLNLPPLPKSYSRYSLDVSGSKNIRGLTRRDYFVATRVLDASNCAIESLDVETWTSLMSIESVSLAGNKLRALAPQFRTLNTTRNITLGANDWSCSCDNRWMSYWIKSVEKSSKMMSGRLDSDSIRCSSPSRLRGRVISQMSDDDFCVDPVSRAILICMSLVAAGIAVLIALTVTVYRLRFRLYRRWKFHPFDRDECAGEEMDYDVFWCCSSNDDDPHGQRVLKLMESRGYRVCYHMRDFFPGERIADNICRSVQRSKRTVCLLSKNFLESHYCMTEFDMAFHHNVAVKRKKRLIALMLLSNPTDLLLLAPAAAAAGDAEDEGALMDTTLLCQYLRQYTYIDYTADGWLDKLLYALPIHGLDRNQKDEETDRLVTNTQGVANYAALTPAACGVPTKPVIHTL